MLSSRPYGLFVQGDSPTERDQSLIDHTVRHLSNIKETSKLDTLRLVRTLPDGGYVVVQDAGGNLRVIVKKLSFSEKYVRDGMAKDYVPILYSGVITKARLLENEGLGMKITKATQRRMNAYKSNSEQAINLSLKRFVIEYNPKFELLKPQITGIFKFTQYDKQRPTWYSGAMSEVMQIVGGYGKQNYSEENEYRNEPSKISIPAKYLDEILTEIDNIRLPGYSGLPDEEGVFHYDYRFHENHIVSFDAENNPWLVQINSEGVHAMPLPIIPATSTKAFREYMEEVADDEILKILDRFGALPSGEAFPMGKDFQAWKRAGVIIKICDTADFYRKNPYYFACGWSTNSRGTECFNTCWDYNDDYLLYSYAYKARLQLQSCPDRGWLNTTSISTENSQVIGPYLNALFEALEDDVTGISIRYKLRRADEDLILARARNYNGGEIDQNEILYWDAVSLEPIAIHSGSINRVYQGPVYWGSKVETSMGRLKFPEMRGSGCESFIMTSPFYDGPSVRCDTVMFGCYIDDRLEVIKYFIDDRKHYKQVESTFDDNMTVGQWSKKETTGQTGIAGYFYTTSFDDRRETPPSVTETNIVGSDMGYGNPLWRTPGYPYRVGTLSRSRCFKHITKVKTTSGIGVDMAVCVPVYMRDAILYGHIESSVGVYESEQHSKGSIVDPNSYQFWCNDFIYFYMGFTVSGNLGEPRSVNGVPVYLDSHIYSPNDKTDFADQGDWMGVPKGSFLDVTPTVGKYTSRTSPVFNINGVSIGGEEPQIKPFFESKSRPGDVISKTNLCMSTLGAIKVKDSLSDSGYIYFSPTQASGGQIYFYRDACKVTFGESKYANISEMNGQQRYKWGHSTLLDSHQAFHFVGVINE